MEQNKFELLDEVETDINTQPDAKPELKEYEKLLLAERNRRDHEKAIRLIKYGCFEQKTEPTVDYNELELIPTKKYKGIYTLYRHNDTMQLMFVCPLVEDNKGDTTERKDLKPYAYDIIYIEAMDNETYLMVSKAARNNIKNALTIGYKTSIILYFVGVALLLINFFYHVATQFQSSGSFGSALFAGMYYCASFFAGLLIATPILVLLILKYKKYKEE